MPTIPLVLPSNGESDPIRVLVTGFDRFRGYETRENPSWLAVRQLQNLVLEPPQIPVSPVVSTGSVKFATGFPAPPIHPDLKDPKRKTSRPIHITALKMPVTYRAVLACVPGFHARPPVLVEPPPANHPPSAKQPEVLKSPPVTLQATADIAQELDAGPPPPDDGYDLVLHVGVGGNGGLRVERLAHKLGYNSPDAEGALAPIVPKSPKGGPGKNGDSHGDDGSGGGVAGDQDVQDVQELNFIGKSRAIMNRDKGIVRGFGAGFEEFETELETDIDVDALVEHLHESGYLYAMTSDDPGRFLCDFIYYCSLAEQQRQKITSNGIQSPHESASTNSPKKSKVLFVHCPPVDEPLNTEDVVDGLKRIICWIAGRESTE